MRRRSLIVALLLLVAAPSLFAHDLFLKLTHYFPAPNRPITVTVLNGTFTTSENAITRDRLRDISVVAMGERKRIDTSAWQSSKDSTRSSVTVDVGGSATYVLGASTLPRELTLSGKDFVSYLEEEGLGDIVAARRRSGELEKEARERYHKHVKAIFQVGETRTDDFRAVLGYPAEIVPQTNPYSLKVGQSLPVQCLIDGRPAVGVTVLAGGRTLAGERILVQTLRADSNGIARVHLNRAGTWYVKFIGMRRLDAGTVNYESKWATLTFGLP